MNTMNNADFEQLVNEGWGLFLEKKKYREALDAFNRAIELNPEEAGIWQGKAEALYHIGLTRDSLTSIEKALSYDKENASFLNTKGVILLRLCKNEEAAKIFEEAFQKKGDHRYIYNEAVALVRLKRFEEAEEALGTAIAIASSDKSLSQKKIEKGYRTQLGKLRRGDMPVMWLTWWYTGTGWHVFGKRILSTLLLLLLAIYLILPLFTLNIELQKELQRESWISVGKDWQSYIVPVFAILIILLSPMFLSLGPQNVRLSPILPPPEIEARRIY